MIGVLNTCGSFSPLSLGRTDTMQTGRMLARERLETHEASSADA